jgi:hypothetical protein
LRIADFRLKKNNPVNQLIYLRSSNHQLNQLNKLNKLLTQHPVINQRPSPFSLSPA